MKKIITLLLVASLSSCVLVIGDEDVHYDDGQEEYSDNNYLANRVEDRLESEPLLDIEDLDVTSKNGVVYLRGIASDSETVRRAINVAMQDEDVRSVSSRIEVSVTKY